MAEGQKKMLSFRDHMNEKHKKIDLTIRLIFIPLILVFIGILGISIITTDFFGMF